VSRSANDFLLPWGFISNEKVEESMLRHIGADSPNKHVQFVLETRLIVEKKLRDAWLEGVCHAAMRHDQPLAKSLEGKTQAMFQRKVATFSYNQYGLARIPFHRIAHTDHHNAIRGNIGTRDWVPWVNMSSWSFNKAVRGGTVLVHRVHHKGYGTDRSLKQGGWEFRWNKVYQRNVLQYNRIS
jgi:hypothetical protein